MIDAFYPRTAGFNLPSPDVVARGQLSEVKKTDNVLPFDDMSKNSLDTISKWNDIDKIVQQHNHQKIR
jgi:hypothetical protein